MKTGLWITHVWKCWRKMKMARSTLCPANLSSSFHPRPRGEGGRGSKNLILRSSLHRKKEMLWDFFLSPIRIFLSPILVLDTFRIDQMVNYLSLKQTGMFNWILKARRFYSSHFCELWLHSPLFFMKSGSGFPGISWIAEYELLQSNIFMAPSTRAI